MKKSKKFSILFIVLFFVSILAVTITSQAHNSNTGTSCACHGAPSATVNIISLNGTSVNTPLGTDFTLEIYANTTATLTAFRIRADFGGSSLTSDPLIAPANTGVLDGGGDDPDPAAKSIGNASVPLLVNFTNVPSSDSTVIIRLMALTANGGSAGSWNYVDITLDIGLGGAIPTEETPLQWFIRTQVPLIIIFCLVFGVAIVASLLVNRMRLNRSNEERDKESFLKKKS